MNRIEAFANAGFDVEMYVPTPTRGVTKDVREDYKRNKTREMMFNDKIYVHRFPLYAEGKNPILRALRYALCAECSVLWIEGKKLWCDFCTKYTSNSGRYGGEL